MKLGHALPTGAAAVVAPAVAGAEVGGVVLAAGAISRISRKQRNF